MTTYFTGMSLGIPWGTELFGVTKGNIFAENPTRPEGRIFGSSTDTFHQLSTGNSHQFLGPSANRGA